MKKLLTTFLAGLLLAFAGRLISSPAIAQAAPAGPGPPAAGPSPTIMIKKIAQTRSGMVRKRAINPRAAIRNAGCGD
ncbi:MAG: hypothetical protein ACOVPA_14645, partial [Rubrivivax sp.]